MITSLAHSVVDIVFPPRCRLCEAWMDDGKARFCSNCIPLIQAEREQPSCPRCGGTVALFEVSGGKCAECRDQTLHVAGTARVGEYFGTLGQMVRAYKFAGREHFEQILGAFLVESACRSDWWDRVEAIVSVPTHWTRRLRRPVHPADALAEVLASCTDLPLARVLRRVRAGPHQIGLSYTDRLTNIRGAFAMRPNVSLDHARLLLVDDVRTTGATLNECARVLRRGGAEEVYAAVVVTVGGVGPGAAILASI